MERKKGMFDYFKKGKIANHFLGGYHKDSYVGLGYESYPFKDFPVEVQRFLKAERVERNLENLNHTLDSLITRLDEVEDYLSNISHKLNQMEMNQQMMLTSKEDLALKLTDEKAEIRKLGESIAEVKKMMGVI